MSKQKNKREENIFEKEGEEKQKQTKYNRVLKIVFLDIFSLCVYATQMRAKSS